MPRRRIVPGLGLGLLFAGSTVLVLGLACGEEPQGAPPVPRPEIDLADVPYETLSEYGFFVGELVDEAPATGVLPYMVAAPLFADGAGKGRFLFLPEGET